MSADFTENDEPTVDHDKNEKYLYIMKNEFFTGRKSLIEKIADLKNKNIIILNGLPGIGKTSVAIEYMYQKVKDSTYKNAYWFDAVDKQKIIDRMLEYGRKLVDPSIKSDDTMIIANFIKSIDSGDVLLVFDNVEALKDVVDAINIHILKCKILITTRNPAVKSLKATKIGVSSFNMDEAREFLQKKLFNFDKDQIEAIIERLKLRYQASNTDTQTEEILPYTLVILTSSYLNNQNQDVDFILKSNNEFMKCFLANLEKKSKEVVDLLKYIMLIEPSDIPGKLIERILLGRDYKAAVKILLDQNLCKMSSPGANNYGISIHRLLQQDLKDNLELTQEQIADMKADLVAYIENLFPETNYEPSQDWTTADVYSRHLKALGDEIVNNSGNMSKLFYKISLHKRFVLRNYESALEDAKKALEKNVSQEVDENYFAKLYSNIGSIYSLLSKENEAIENYTHALESYKRFFGNSLDQREIASIYNNIGQSYTILSKHKEAMDYKELALNMKERIFNTESDNDNLELAISLDAIAGTYSDTGKEKKAFEYYERALGIREKILKKEDNPYLAKSYNSIGLSYCRLGDNENAYKFFLKSLEMRQRLYKGDHHEIAMSYNNIGLAVSQMGEAKKSLEYKFISLEMRKRLYNGDHYRLTISYHGIGGSFSSIGDDLKAIKYYKISLRMKRRIFKNADHDDYISLLEDIGNSYSYTGAENKALEYYFESVEMRKRLQKYRPMLILLNIGKSYSFLGNEIKAIEYYELAFEVAKTDSSKTESNMSTLYSCFAISYLNLGEKEKALEYLEKCLAVKFKGNHLLAIQNNEIGFIYYKLKDEQNSIEHYKMAATLKLDICKDDSRFVALSYIFIAMVYSNLHDRENAMKYQKLSTEMYERLFGKNDHPRIARSIYNVGIVYSNLGDHEESLRYHLLSKDMRTRLFSESHLAVAKSYKKIGLEYSHLGDQNKALECLQRALEIRTDLFEEDSLCVAKIYKYLGNIHLKNNCLDKALENYELSLKMFNKFLDDENETVKECLNTIVTIKSLI